MQITQNLPGERQRDRLSGAAGVFFQLHRAGQKKPFRLLITRAARARLPINRVFVVRWTAGGRKERTRHRASNR